MNTDNDINTPGNLTIPETEVQDNYLYSTPYTC